MPTLATLSLRFFEYAALDDSSFQGLARLLHKFPTSVRNLDLRYDAKSSKHCHSQSDTLSSAFPVVSRRLSITTAIFAQSLVRSSLDFEDQDLSVRLSARLCSKACWKVASSGKASQSRASRTGYSTAVSTLTCASMNRAQSPTIFLRPPGVRSKQAIFQLHGTSDSAAGNVKIILDNKSNSVACTQRMF